MIEEEIKEEIKKIEKEKSEERSEERSENAAKERSNRYKAMLKLKDHLLYLMRNDSCLCVDLFDVNNSPVNEPLLNEIFRGNEEELKKNTCVISIPGQFPNKYVPYKSILIQLGKWLDENKDLLGDKE